MNDQHHINILDRLEKLETRVNAQDEVDKNHRRRLLKIRDEQSVVNSDLLTRIYALETAQTKQDQTDYELDPSPIEAIKYYGDLYLIQKLEYSKSASMRDACRAEILRRMSH